jgi:hypothetical protein
VGDETVTSYICTMHACACQSSSSELNYRCMSTTSCKTKLHVPYYWYCTCSGQSRSIYVTPRTTKVGLSTHTIFQSLQDEGMYMVHVPVFITRTICHFLYVIFDFLLSKLTIYLFASLLGHLKGLATAPKTLTIPYPPTIAKFFFQGAVMMLKIKARC